MMLKQVMWQERALSRNKRLIDRCVIRAIFSCAVIFMDAFMHIKVTLEKSTRFC